MSCALRILLAETISSARVTLRVFWTLLIWPTISLDPLMMLAQFRVGFLEPQISQIAADWYFLT
jgi:hypothetical protein